MNTEINFKIAKLLKEKGFVEPTQKAYIGNDTLFVNFEQSYGENDFYFDADDFYENWNKKGWVFNVDGNGCFGCKLDNIKYFEAYSAPTIAEVVMWMYEKHNQWIVVKPYLNQWQFELHKKPNPLSSCTPIHNTVLHNNPTAAYEAAIEYTLTNLIK